MAIIIHPHALQRMEERGATREEVLETIETGRMSPGKFDRRIHEMTCAYGDFWRSQLYEYKHIEVYSIEDGEDVIVVTVVVKYY